MFHHKHINVLNKIALFFEKAAGATLSPSEEEMKRVLSAAKIKLERQLERAWRREQRHASWPYCGKRHRARIARQVAAGSLKEANGLVIA